MNTKKLLFTRITSSASVLLVLLACVDPVNAQSSQCSDGIDNDGDNAIDVEDGDGSETCYTDGEIYYFASDGNDAWDGLAPSWDGTNGPKRTLAAAESIINNTMGAGDHLRFQRGDTWTETSRSTSLLISDAVGTAGDPIVIGAYGTGERPILSHNVNYQAIAVRGSPANTSQYVTIQDIHLTTAIIPSSANPPTGLIIYESWHPSGHPHHITLDNLLVERFSFGINAYGSDLTLQNSIIRNNNNIGQPNSSHSSGFLLNGISNLVIRNNLFENNGKPTSGFDHNVYLDSGENVLFESNEVTDGNNVKIRGGTDITVRANHFHDLINSAIGMGASDSSGDLLNVVVEGNLFEDVRDSIAMFNQAAAGPSRGIRGVSIRNNVIRDRTPGSGDWPSFVHLTDVVEDLTFEYNTIIGVTGEQVIGLSPASGSSNLVFRNNIFSSTDASYPIIRGLNSLALSILSIDYNLYDTSGSLLQDDSNANYYGIGAIQTAYPNFEQNGIEADPLFVSEQARDLHLQTSSPAIDATSSTSIFVDYDGVSRPQLNGWDIGAFEFLSGTGCASDFDCDGILDAVDPDDDNDGMTDTYENTHTGLDPLDASDAALDLDNDGLSNLEEFNISPLLDPNDPDTDGDGISDGLDNEPLISDNNCTGGTAADAMFTDMVTTDVTCGATTSIMVVTPAEVQDPGHLRLIAPTIEFFPGFKSGELTVISTNPCMSCGS